jgi:tetratricopeptide (TPR) repeat protein
LRELYQLDAAELAFKQALRADSQMLEARRSLVGLMGIERRETDQLSELWSWYQSGVSPIEPLRLIAQSVVVIPPGTLAKTIDEGMVLEKSVQAEPDSTHIRPALARYYRNRGEVDKALGLLDDWLKTHQEDVPEQIERLFCLVEAGDLDLASLVIAKAPEAWRKSANFWIASGDHQRNQSQWQEAVQAYEQALLIDSRQPETYYRLAECKRALGLGVESAKLLEKHASIRKLAELAAVVDPNTPGVTGMMAVANLCRTLNRDREARAWAMEVLRLDRNHSEARSLVDQVKP